MVKKPTSGMKEMLTEILDETREYALTLFDWSIAGFMTLGKFVWFGAVLGVMLGFPAIMIKDFAFQIDQDLKEAEMSRKVKRNMEVDSYDSLWDEQGISL